MSLAPTDSCHCLLSTGLIDAPEFYFPAQMQSSLGNLRTLLCFAFLEWSHRKCPGVLVDSSAGFQTAPRFSLLHCGHVPNLVTNVIGSGVWDWLLSDLLTTHPHVSGGTPWRCHLLHILTELRVMCCTRGRGDLNYVVL